MISIANLNKRFGKLIVLDGLNLSFDKGGIHTILGPNGSGKTTLIKSILGMVLPNSGSIEINGKQVIGMWEYRNEISYLPQIAHFPNNLKVSELFKMIKDLRKGAINEEKLIAGFKLAPFFDKKLGNLSGGTSQKVNIALTFMFNSPFIILDEPTTGLDPVSLIYLKIYFQGTITKLKEKTGEENLESAIANILREKNV